MASSSDCFCSAASSDIACSQPARG
jgi:hypothetical protein